MKTSEAYLNQSEEKVRSFLSSSNIKLIVFDLHGTLTNRTSIHPYHIEYRNKYIEKLLGYPIDENFIGGTDEVFALYPQLSKKDFYMHRDSDPLFEFNKIHLPNPILVEKLKLISDNFHTVLYTDSYINQIEKTLNAIGIKDCFDKLIGMESGFRKVTSQFIVYPKLCQEYGIEISNVLIVGDRMDKDINPVLQAGGNGIQVQSSLYILEALEIINKKFIEKTE